MESFLCGGSSSFKPPFIPSVFYGCRL
uniref:Uncharacterized protein n=1 Tax=Arundo donax TaxID=35708 RepID=A0A0A9B1I5_ARUDO